VPSVHDANGLSLPGYTLSTRLGAGGYGEVWLAHAPGGLTKAVKFIFGSYNDKRAEHELRALQKVKEVRHPFLLSLERIEVVDGRLVIVTELADGSLKDRFDECVKQGLAGVPRDELIAYLRDAADALDYLSHKHRLQHLDVKPENLLLLAGHVKVADFGLVKDVGKSQASLVGGLTPLYSAPEVFQGAPTVYSDQYSLAVLYQEMLTGVLPFDGATAAELTLQHLHDDPNLTPLPASDRYIVSRALAKEPTQRYANCTELVEALVTGGKGQAESASSSAWSVPEVSLESAAPAAPAERRRGPVTEFFGEELAQRPKEITNSMLLAVEPLEATDPVALPPLELPAAAGACRPTVVIGIGGAAGDVLRQLRQRIARQYGEDSLPAVQLLLLDSDPKAIGRALEGDARIALKPEETLSLPLRRPQEYREQSGRLMRWLSRRWLYNIPRSLRTEGMRPLGRLAFADHARQAVQRIRMALSAAVDPEGLQASRERTALDFQGPAPRVYVIAAISGGAGSGMSLDVGYAVRAALEKMGAVDAPVVGIFLHATGRDPRHCDLAKVNSFAWLTEYNHFHRAGGAFPGDESCGLPAMPAGRKAFDSAYLLDLGIEPEDGASLAAAHAIAEYVYLDALTPAQAFFEACRREADLPSGAAPLRTFAVHKIPAASDDAIDRAAATLSREVVLSWTGGDSAATSPTSAGMPAGASVRDTNQIVQGAGTLVAQLQLKLDGLASNARSLIDAQFGGDLQEFLQNLLATVTPEGRRLGAVDALRAIDRLFAPPNDEDQGAYVLQRPLDAIVSPLSMKLAGDLAMWVLQKLDDRQERLAGAQRAVQWMVEHLKRVDADAARLGDGLSRQAAGFVDELRRDAKADAAPPAAAIARSLAYFRMRIDQQAVRAGGIIARRLLGELKSVGATISEFGRHLKHMAVNLPAGATPEQGDGLADPLAAAIADRLAVLTAAIDAELQSQFIDPQGGLLTTIMGNSRIRAQMLVALGKLSRRTAEELASRPEVLNSALAALDANGGDESCLAVIPPFLEHGGAYRKLTVMPAEAGAARAASPLAGDATVAVAPGADVVTVCEGWRLPLVHVALDLIQRRRDYADFAGRVQTRCDVPWAPLTSPAASIAPAADAFAGVDLGPDAEPIRTTHVL
jgi:hypothetical protein